MPHIAWHNVPGPTIARLDGMPNRNGTGHMRVRNQGPGGYIFGLDYKLHDPRILIHFQNLRIVALDRNGRPLQNIRVQFSKFQGGENVAVWRVNHPPQQSGVGGFLIEFQVTPNSLQPLRMGKTFHAFVHKV